MIDPITTTIAVHLVPLFIRFFVRLVKNKRKKKRLRAQQEQERKRKAEEAEELKAYCRQEVQNAKERVSKEDRKNEQKWEGQERAKMEAKLEAREEEVKREKKRQAQLERELEREREFNEKLRLNECLMRKWDGQEQAKMEAKLEAREKEVKREKKRQAELEREREFINEKLRVMEEKLEREKKERKEGEKKAKMETKFLSQALQYAFRLFKDLMLRQQSKPCSCGMHPCRCNHSLKQQEREELLAHFGLLESGSDNDLLNIFGESNTLPQDNPSNSKARNIDLLELPEQLPSGFEEDILTMAMTTINDATQSKEKGNTYFEEQKFEEAIKWYSKSIDELPTAIAYCNRAMAYLKLNKFIEVEKDCTEALRIDDRYFKAYARRAIARTRLGSNLEGALVDVQVALELESNSKEMVELYAELMSLKDIPGSSKASNVALSELPEQFLEEDKLTMAMTTINGPENAVGTTLLELDYQLFR